MGYIGAIINGIGQTINLIGRATSSPNYPSLPKLSKINIPLAQQNMEQYEQQRMQSSVDAWKQQFPDLYAGGAYEINDIQNQQKGMLGGHIDADLASSGLGPVHEGTNQYALSRDIGLSPITLSQRTSQAVTRNIAQNPEWTNKITGGTLATMMANNYQNQQAYGMFKNAAQTALYTAGQLGGAYNTQALLGSLTGAGRISAQVYNNNQYSALSPIGQGAYGQPSPNMYSPAPSLPYQPYAGQPSTGSSYSGPLSPNYQYGNNFFQTGGFQAAPSSGYGPFLGGYVQGMTPWNNIGTQYYDNTDNTTPDDYLTGT